MVGPGTEWPDGRLNELAIRVERAATKEEMASLRRELQERAEGVKQDVATVGRKVESLAGDPFTERRQKRNAIVVGVVAALSGVGATSLLYLAQGVH